MSGGEWEDDIELVDDLLSLDESRLTRWEREFRASLAEQLEDAQRTFSEAQRAKAQLIIEERQ